MKMVLVDICNSIADINHELEKRGYRTDVYPSPIPGKVWNEEIFKNARPIEQVIEVVKRFKERGCSIVYITARPPEFHEITNEWLKKNGLPSGMLIYTLGLPKGEIIDMLNISPYAVIEDSPHEIQSYLSFRPDIELLIPNWPYNQHLITHGTRIKTNNLTFAM